MADLIPIRIKDAETAPSVGNNTWVAVDDPAYPKGYKWRVNDIASQGRLIVDVAWNMYANWYAPDIPITIDRDKFLAMYATVFDDDGNAYESHDVFDAATSGQEGKPTSDPYILNWRSRWGLTTRFNYNTNRIQLKHNNHHLDNDWDLWDNPTGWGNRPTYYGYSSAFLAKYKATDRVRVRIVILYLVD